MLFALKRWSRNTNIHTSRYYKATINDHCRITGFKAAVQLNPRRREINESDGN